MIKLSTDKKLLQEYLLGQGWLKNGENIQSVEKPGEGNMNFTLRIDTGQRTFIIKQSRGYVEKYPQVSAPVERVQMEADFYNLVSEKPDLKAKTPTILGLDADNSIMIMDDLGAGSDYTFIYRKGETIPEKELFELIDFAADLHTGFSPENTSKKIDNRKMRALNHEHMYIYPYMEENGFNLDQVVPGLQEVAKTYKEDTELLSKATELGKLYLEDGKVLLHGDYFPGSWLNTADGVKVIDPEFCFFGLAEFEIGVTVAHLKLAEQPEPLIAKALDRYHAKNKIDDALRKKFTGGEIIRRVLGLAQLPLDIDLEKRKILLKSAQADLLTT